MMTTARYQFTHCRIANPAPLVAAENHSVSYL